MNSQPENQIEIREMEDYSYYIWRNHFASGKYCKAYKAVKKVGEELNQNSEKFVIKKIKYEEVEKIYHFIDNEIKNKHIFEEKKINCAIILRDWFRTKENDIYLVYQYEDVITLKNLIKNSEFQKIEISDKICIASSLAECLKEFHQNNYVHRNIKLTNILISKDLKVKLSGLKYSCLQLNGENNKDSKELLECIKKNEFPAYELIPYEEETNIILTQKLDIYDYGIILLHLFSNSTTIKQKYDIWKTIEENNENLIKELIKKCISLFPCDRPSIQEIIDQLKIIQQNNDNNKLKTKELALLKNPDQAQKLETKKAELEIRTIPTLENYEKTGNTLGEGGFGKVIEIRNIKNRKIYALKIIKMSEIQGNPKAKELVYGEIALLNNLKDIHFVVGLIDFFYYEKNLCLILEYCNGRSLENYIKQLKKANQKIDLNELKIISWNIAEGMRQLHSKKIVHRDLKPDNILLIKDSNDKVIDAKICDLGLSRNLKDQKNDSFYTICGTTPYMAPEMIKNKKNKKSVMDFKVDVFAFGLILYYMLYQDHAYNLCPDMNYFPFNLKIPEIKEKDLYFKDIVNIMKNCLKEDPIERCSFENILTYPFYSKNFILDLDQKYANDLEKIVLEEAQLKTSKSNQSNTLFYKIFNKNKLEKKLFDISKEIDFCLKMKNLPHIIQLLGYGYHNNRKQIVLVYEYCNGESLNKLANIRKNVYNTLFTQSEILIVSKCLLESIEKIHKKCYVLNFISPDNILIILSEGDPIEKKGKNDKDAQLPSQIIEAKLSCFEKSELQLLGSMNNEEGFYNSDEEDFNPKKYYPCEEKDLKDISNVILYMYLGGKWDDFLSKLKKEGFENFLDKISNVNLRNLYRLCSSLNPNDLKSTSKADELKEIYSNLI